MSMRRTNSKTKHKGIKFTQQSLTEQCHKDEVKIQNVVRKSQQTGVVTHVNKYAGTYSNMVDAPDFYNMQLIIANAKTMFETVPSHIRKDFDNDPGKFLAFMQEPQNVEKIEEYGLDTSHLDLSSLEAPEGDSDQIDLEALIQEKKILEAKLEGARMLKPADQFNNNDQSE